MANSAEMGQINWIVKATVDQATESVKKLSNNISGLSKVLKLVNFTAFIASCKRIGQTIFNAVNQTSQYIQKMNQFKSIMGDSANEAQNFIDKAERILGLDPEQMMGSLSSFQTLTKGFGIASDEAYKMSKNLTQLAADMSSFTGESMDLALQRLKSGISGEIEPMRKWGIALDQATLQERAHALGINKKVSEMTRAQKTELAYYQIMHATQYAQGNMARTLLTPASALRIVQTEFKQLGRAMGSVFIPIAMKIIPVIRAITQILTELARKLAALFGFKISDYEVKDVAASFGDMEDNVNGTTKALKKMLMPFDELNNVNFDTGKGSKSGITGVGGSLGLDTYDYDMFAGASDKMNEKVEEIKNNLEKLKPVIIAVGGAIASIWVIDKIVKFKEWLDKVKAASSELGTVLQLALVIGGAFLIYKGIKRAIETDWDAKSLLMMIGGTSLIAVAGALRFKSNLPLEIGLSLSLVLVGVWLIYKGIKRAIDTDWDAKSLLMMIGGTGLIAVAGALKFKSVLPLQIGLSLGLILGAVWLIYKGIQHAIDVGEIDGQSFLEIISGGALASAGAAILLKNPAMFKIGLGLTFTLAGIAVEFESVKKMLEGDISLGTILKATGNAFLIGLGVWMLTGSLTAGLLVTAGVLALNLGIQIGMALKQIDWEAIGKKIQEVKDGIVERFETLKTDVHEKVEKIKNDATEKFETMKNSIQQKANEMKENVSTNFETFKNNVSQKIDEMKTNASSNFENFKNNVEQKANDIKNNVTTNFENLKTNVQQKVEDMKNNASSKFEDFKNNTRQKIEDMKNNVSTGFENMKTSIGDKISNIKTKVQNIFTDIKNGIVGKINDAKEGVRNAIDRIKGFFNFNWSLPHLKTPHLSWTTKPASGWVADILSALSLPTSLPKLNIEWYASGGFPKEGQIFGANENGPELIGNIGRRTAVANQQQITEGISEATYSAFSRALNENRSNGDSNPYFVIKLEDDTPLYKGQAKKENQYSNMYGVRM